MQVGNCFVPRRGSGDNARYARVSCEETLETCERIRSNVVWNDRSAVGLLSLPRCRTRTGGTGRHSATPRAHSAHQTRWGLTRHPALRQSAESGPIIVNVRAPHPRIHQFAIIVEIIVEYALGLRLSHIIRSTVTAHRFRVSGLPPATISSLRYRPGADSSSASSQMCPRTRRGRE